MERLAAVMRAAKRDDPRWARFGLSLMNVVSERHAPRLLRLVEPELTASDEDVLTLASAWADLARMTNHGAHERRALELASAAGGRYVASAAMLQGGLLGRSGDWAGAASAYQQALEHDPENWAALNNLAYALLAIGRHQEAVATAQRALRQRPEDPDLLDTCAQALLASGDVAAARLHAERAVSRRPDDPAALLTLTRALVAAERFDEAGTYIERANRAAHRPGRAADREDESLRSELRAMQETISAIAAGAPHRSDR